MSTKLTLTLQVEIILDEFENEKLPADLDSILVKDLSFSLHNPDRMVKGYSYSGLIEGDIVHHTVLSPVLDEKIEE